ncbi:hypothetical protein LCGC14_1878550, partial [marine sediment metagenome]
MSAGTWYLDGVGSETFNKTYTDSASYLLDNYTLSDNYFDYTGAHFDINGETSTPRGITWDGTNFWVVDFIITREVYQYTVAGVYTGTHFDVGAVDGATIGITWNGTHFWTVSQSGNAYGYTAAGVYTGDNFDTSGEMALPTDITWDGTNFWIVDINLDEVYQYTALGVYTGVSFDIFAEAPISFGITWDGTYLWVTDVNNGVYKYTDAGVYTGTYFDTLDEDGGAMGVVWDGTYFWITGQDNLEVYQYAPDRIISKYYHGGDLIYMQTNETETFNLRNIAGTNVSVVDGNYMYFNINSTTENIQLKFYLGGVEQVEYILLQNNVNSNNQTVLINIDSDFTFDQVEFIGVVMSDTEYFVCYGYEVYEYLTGYVYEMYIDPDGQDYLMAQFGNYTLEIYERSGGSFSLQITQNIT